jgi:16S rRNA (guanine(1405)-N(7))-methyltransferase
MKITTKQIGKIIENIEDSRKYRRMGLNHATLTNLISQEAPKHSSQKKLIKAVKRKLHNIVAPYLGDPDYAELYPQLHQLKGKSVTAPAVRAFCQQVLGQHASTAERLPHLESFYQRIFETIGVPESILDLACGLQPFALPWMGLPTSTHYYAFDIVQPRIEFINTFFTTFGLEPLAKNEDILVHPPKIQADAAFFFKEAHRFEKRSPGCNQAFWRSLDVRTLVISLPARNLSGTHSLTDQHRLLVKNNLPENQPMQEVLIEDEMIFIIPHPGE